MNRMECMFHLNASSYYCLQEKYSNGTKRNIRKDEKEQNVLI